MIAKRNDDSFAVLILLLLLIPLMWLYYNQKLENSQSRHNKKSGKVYQEGPQNHYSKRKGGKRRKTKSKAKVRHPKNSADQNGDASTNSSILDMLWGRRRGVEEEKDNVNEDDEQKMPSVSFVAMDCEMVGIGRQGINSMLARCSIVSVDEEFILEESKNEDCDDEDDCNCDENDLKKSPMKMPRIKVLYDVYVKPTKHVTDYRTEYSGITPEHFERDDAVTYEVCRSKVLSMLNSTEDRVVVLIGHALKNDFQVLRYWVSSLNNTNEPKESSHNPKIFFISLIVVLINALTF